MFAYVLAALLLWLAPAASAQEKPRPAQTYRVVQADAHRLQLQNRDGWQKQLLLSAATVYRRDGRRSPSPEELRAGDFVRVREGNDAQGQLLALEVDQRSNLILRGRVVDCDGQRLTLETYRGPVTIALSRNTQYWYGSLQGPALGLTPGAYVKLQAHSDPAGSLEASTVQVRLPWAAIGMAVMFSLTLGFLHYRRRAGR